MFLYCRIGEDAPSYADESYGDIDVFKAVDEDRITGYDVFNFAVICADKPAEYYILKKLLAEVEGARGIVLESFLTGNAVM